MNYVSVIYRKARRRRKLMDNVIVSLSLRIERGRVVVRCMYHPADLNYMKNQSWSINLWNLWPNDPHYTRSSPRKSKVNWDSLQSCTFIALPAADQKSSYTSVKERERERERDREVQKVQPLESCGMIHKGWKGHHPSRSISFSSTLFFSFSNRIKDHQSLWPMSIGFKFRCAGLRWPWRGANFGNPCRAARTCSPRFIRSPSSSPLPSFSSPSPSRATLTIPWWAF